MSNSFARGRVEPLTFVHNIRMLAVVAWKKCRTAFTRPRFRLHKWSLAFKGNARVTWMSVPLALPATRAFAPLVAMYVFNFVVRNGIGRPNL